jgi:hypothetical protein
VLLSELPFLWAGQAAERMLVYVRRVDEDAGELHGSKSRRERDGVSCATLSRRDPRARLVPKRSGRRPLLAASSSPSPVFDTRSPTRLQSEGRCGHDDRGLT